MRSTQLQPSYPSRITYTVFSIPSFLCGPARESVLEDVFNKKSFLAHVFLIGLVPFIVSFVTYQIHNANKSLFESIMPVSIGGVMKEFAPKIHDYGRRESAPGKEEFILKFHSAKEIKCALKL